MRMPSEQLVDRLTRHNLCSLADLKACEPFVARMCRDLPDFDSVWLDALVQRRLLTPFQATLLSSAAADTIRRDSLVLTDELGERTRIAYDFATRKTVVIRDLKAQRPQTYESLLGRLQQLQQSVDEKGIGRQAASMVIPVRILAGVDQPANSQTEDRAASATNGFATGAQQTADGSRLPCESSMACESSVGVVYPFVAGWRLDELLIRGGRLPWHTVAEIGRDLLQGLSWLESVRLMHGDVVSKNVILRPSGQAVLTSAFLRRIDQPHIVFSSSLTLRACEGIAPEQISGARTADARSELYALGCVLWQALTCRPVALSADPVTRLTFLQNHDIADVRTIVPDCPDWLAEVIQGMTRRTPELRPGSARDVLTEWMRHCGNGHRRTRRLLKQMPDHRYRSNHSIAQPRRTSRIPVGRLAGLLLVLGGLVTGGYSLGLTPQTLRFGLTREVATVTDQRSATGRNDLARGVAVQTMPPQPIGTADSPVKLPAPAADGMIRLQPSGHYTAGSVRAAESVSLLGDARRPATIHVSPFEVMEISAAAVHLTGVRFVKASDISRELGASTATGSTGQLPKIALHEMLDIRCVDLVVEECQFANYSDAPTATSLLWESHLESPGRLSIRNSTFTGNGTAVRTRTIPLAVDMNNVLLATTGAAIYCDVTSAGTTAINLNLNRVTQVKGHSTVNVALRSRGTSSIVVKTMCVESVFCPTQAVLAFAGPPGTFPEQFRGEFLAADSGTPAVLRPDAAVAVFIDPQLRTLVALSEQQIVADGLLVAEPEFHAAANGDSANDLHRFELLDYEGPKIKLEMPGIQTAAFPWHSAFVAGDMTP